MFVAYDIRQKINCTKKSFNYFELKIYNIIKYDLIKNTICVFLSTHQVLNIPIKN